MNVIALTNPTELAVKIASYVDLPGLLSLRRTNKAWFDLILNTPLFSRKILDIEKEKLIKLFNDKKYKDFRDKVRAFPHLSSLLQDPEFLGKIIYNDADHYSQAVPDFASLFQRILLNRYTPCDSEARALVQEAERALKLLKQKHGAECEPYRYLAVLLGTATACSKEEKRHFAERYQKSKGFIDADAPEMRELSQALPGVLYTRIPQVSAGICTSIAALLFIINFFTRTIDPAVAVSSLIGMFIVIFIFWCIIHHMCCTHVNPLSLDPQP